MINNLKQKILSFLLASVVTISATSVPVFATTSSSNVTATKEIQAELGKSVTIPLQSVTEKGTVKDGTMSTQQVFPGSAGTVELVPTATQVSYFITMTIPADAFIGSMSIVDVSSGLSSGTVYLYDFHGSVKYNGLKGHRYRAVLEGNAYLGADNVAYVGDDVVLNWIV